MQIEGTGYVTDAQGKFTIPGLKSGGLQLKLHRAGYVDQTQNVTMAAGDNTKTFTMAAKPTVVTLVRTNGTTNRLDPDTVEFGYAVTFGGLVSSPNLKVCNSGGEIVTISRASLAKLIGPSKDATVRNSCCTGAGIPEEISLQLKDNSTLNGATIKDTCQEYRFQVVGGDVDTGAAVFVMFRDLQSLTMP